MVTKDFFFTDDALERMRESVLATGVLTQEELDTGEREYNAIVAEAEKAVDAYLGFSGPYREMADGETIFKEVFLERLDSR